MRSIKLAAKLTTITETIGALIMLSLLVMNFLQVFFRYVLVEPIGWTEEVMRYSVSWMTFLLAGAVFSGCANTDDHPLHERGCRWSIAAPESNNPDVNRPRATVFQRG